MYFFDLADGEMRLDVVGAFFEFDEAAKQEWYYVPLTGRITNLNITMVNVQSSFGTRKETQSTKLKFDAIRRFARPLFAA